MANSRSIFQVVETYEKARITFAHTVAELATRPQNLEVLHNAEVMQLLRPLLLDNVPQVQQNAALALGRLANHGEELAKALVSENILAQVVQSLREQNLHSKKAAASVLKSVAKHSSSLAEAVVHAGSVEQLILCLEEFDPSVKECGASGLGQISRHTPKLAQMVVDAGGVSLLVLAAQNMLKEIGFLKALGLLEELEKPLLGDTSKILLQVSCICTAIILFIGISIQKTF